MKTYPFSRLQKALLAVGSFSCLGLNSVWVHAAEESDVEQLATITTTAQTEQLAYYQPKVNLSGFGQQNLQVFTDSVELIAKLNGFSWENKNLLIMTSGNFSGVNLQELAEKIVGKK